MRRKPKKLNFPRRKISETFLDFAEPLLDGLGDAPTQAQIEESLKVAFTVWNAVVYETVRGETRFLEMIRTATAHQAEVAALIERLVERKRRLFGDDHRLVGDFKLTCRDGDWNLWAEARSPERTA